MPGDIIMNLNPDDFGLGADPETNITGVSFPQGAPVSQILLDGDYCLKTAAGYTGEASAEIISSYSGKNLELLSGVDVVNNDNDLNSSILFQVTKLDVDSVYLHYSYSHTKVNSAGELQTVSGEGIKQLTAGQLNEGLFFGSDPDWTLELNLNLHEVLNFSVGDKFVVQVTPAGGADLDNIKLVSTGEGGSKTVYAITAQREALQGEQSLEFFQLDELTGEHRQVKLLIGVNGLITEPGDPLNADEPAAAVFSVGPFEPENLREYIYQAAAKLKVSPYLENKDYVAAANKPDASGDGRMALEIARLREKLVDGVGKTTFEDFYRGLMTDLGVQGREAQRLESNMNAIYENMAEQAEMVAGVSLDDEMLNLVQYQHAYNAASQFLSVIDEMLDTLINGIK